MPGIDILIDLGGGVVQTDREALTFFPDGPPPMLYMSFTSDMPHR